MKNQNKANAGRAQIADISVAGKELSEEHLRIAGGGFWSGGVMIGACKVTNRIDYTCTVVDREGWCSAWKQVFTIPILDCDSSGSIAK